MTAQRVFISHSHEDRAMAVLIENVLKKHQAETFLDQDHIEVGDVLPVRLENGVEWCSKFLLLWSANAAQSAWVEREWNLAYDLRKSIIPYRLDTYPLPDDLQDRVYIDIEDKSRAHGELLRAVFGRDFKPVDPATLFPGQWEMAIRDPSHPGAEFSFDLGLRRNGQVEGPGHFNKKYVDAMLQDMYGQPSLAYGIDPTVMQVTQWMANQMRSKLESARFFANGSWSYDTDTGELLIDSVINSNLGSSGRFTLRLAVKDEQIAGGLGGTCTFNADGSSKAISAPFTLRRTN